MHPKPLTRFMDMLFDRRLRDAERPRDHLIRHGRGEAQALDLAFSQLPHETRHLVDDDQG